MSTPRFNRTRRAALVVLAAGSIICSLAAASLAAAANPSSSAATARKALQGALAAASRAGSVRVTVHFFSGKTTGEVIQDSARKSAVQTVAIGKERVSIVLTGGTAYFSANPEGLTSYFGFPASVASTASGRWISVSPTDSAYTSVVAGLTLAAALKEASPSGVLTEGKVKTINKQPTRGIAGTGTSKDSPSTIFIATKGKPLPVEAVSSTSTSKVTSGEIVTFSRWGERVKVPTPTDSIPISTLSTATSG